MDSQGYFESILLNSGWIFWILKHQIDKNMIMFNKQPLFGQTFCHSREQTVSQSFVILAKAGIQRINTNGSNALDPRFREDDKEKEE